jgi:transcriptional regulator with XRE-family HTH domain
MYLSSNLRLLRIRKSRTQEVVALAVGTNRVAINNYERGTDPPTEVLAALSTYFGVSMDTLVKVNLHTLSESQFSQLEQGFDVYVKGSGLRILATTVDRNDKENIELVHIKAKAGYTAGYNDQEFISSLPTFQLPFLSDQKKYRTFELDGDSMLPIPNGAFVIAEFVQDWNYIKDGNAYILLTEDDGIVFKVVYNQIRKKKSLLLKSLNPEFKAYELPITAIREAWKFVNYFTSELPQPEEGIEGLRSMIMELKNDVGRMVGRQES